MRRARIFSPLLFALLLICSGADQAQESQDPEGLVVAVESRAGRWWHGIRSFFYALPHIFLPTSPTEVARQIHSSDKPFWALLMGAGYELDEVQATASLIPGVSARFRMARELSDADRDWVQRRLDQLALGDTGMVEELQRSVILMLLEASESETYKIVQVDFVLSPFPGARLVLKSSPRVQSTAPADLAKTVFNFRQHQY
jgi:hypothetical protein